MMTILICLLHTLVPKAAALAQELETPAAVLAVVVFAVLLSCLVSQNSRVSQVFPNHAASTFHS